ncbi:hypothetical protein [Planomicrobium sp. YIM 101495]|uniref:hypothetical protein n=1 Tax=Planomicrobium sp. YIM 101495 TaxID=2665160 RepID=UPI0012B97B06|nr:hypothetical protein [Planomicrobium sp. YIM 101495]MTD31357.1 hypothetical protein [Planomicrobium sp. YIM 101495]
MEKEILNNPTSEKPADSDNKLQSLSGIQLVDFGGSTGLVCDVETGFCGPINQKEEDEK